MRGSQLTDLTRQAGRASSIVWTGGENWLCDTSNGLHDSGGGREESFDSFEGLPSRMLFLVLNFG